MSCSADKFVKFWDFSILPSSTFGAVGSSVGKMVLGLTLVRQIEMAFDALCLCYSPTLAADKLLLAVGLLDNTVKVFYDDSMKFFLSLYGHKLPVMSVAISYDCRILVSGSADKTIKIWGLDFGDCHRSLLAHGDSVTSLCFLSGTHYLLSCSKDGLVKYWDTDRFEKILSLPGHTAGSAVWAVQTCEDGSFFVSVGQDRSLRMWRRTDDLVFVEEEKERELEAQVDSSISQATASTGRDAWSGSGVLIAGGVELDASIADGIGIVSTGQDAATVKSGERLMQGIDLVEAELREIASIVEAGRSKQAADDVLKGVSTLVAVDQRTSDALKKRKANPMLMGLAPHKYLLKTLREIKAPDLESTLLLLPFHYVTRVLPLLLHLAGTGCEVELCVRAAVFILRCHQQQLISTQALAAEVTALQILLRDLIGDYRELVGTNLAGLKYMENSVAEQSTSKISWDLSAGADKDGRSAAAVTSGGDATRGKRRKKN